jgi:hypothetical protein
MADARAGVLAASLPAAGTVREGSPAGGTSSISMEGGGSGGGERRASP